MDTIQPQITNTFEQKVTGFLERKPVIYQFLRFACIGFLNTALNFLVLNILSKALNITQGLQLGYVAAFAFCLAVVQSYLWNKTWTFGAETGVTIWKNLIRLVCVGALGVVAILLALLGSRANAMASYFFGILVVYFIFEAALWRIFGFHASDWHHEGHSFVVFFIVTLIGLGINSGLVALISSQLHLTHTDLDKNLAAVFATAVSLFWNFAGYKVVVFKK